MSPGKITLGYTVILESSVDHKFLILAFKT